MTELSPGTRLGRYELIERLGVGGMAEVWAARQRGVGGFERRVALKRILPRYAGDPRFVARFAAEAHLAETLSHAHIASIYGVEEVDGELVIAMELVRGETLAAIIRRAWELTGAPVEPRLAAAIVARVCRALHHAHTLGDPAGRALGMVHRDISPSNVILGFAGEVKLVDFGIARGLSDAALDGGLGGKPGYMSPEHTRGAPVDGRSDVFSAGVVLWELLTGMRLYGGLEAAATRAAICAPEPARSVLDARSGLPLVLAAVVERALHKDPADRYADAAAMASGLEACAHGLAGGAERAISELMARLFKDRIERWNALLGDAPAPSPAAAPPVAASPYADAAGTDPDEGPPGAFPEFLLAQLDAPAPEGPSGSLTTAPPPPKAPALPVSSDGSRGPATGPSPRVPPPLAARVPPPAPPAPGSAARADDAGAVDVIAPVAALGDEGPSAEYEAAETEPSAVLATAARPAAPGDPRPATYPVADGFEPDPFAEEDDEEVERGPLVSFLATLDAMPPPALPEARPDERQPLALEVIELAPGGGVADTRVVYRDKKREAASGTAANGALKVTVRGRAATVEAPPRAHIVDGDALLPVTGALVVGFAEPTTVELDGVRYRLRVFVPPPRPPRALREVLWGVYAAALVLVVGAHLSTAPLFSVLRELGVTATVEQSEERFAEGRMEKPKPKPTPKPKPKPEVVAKRERPKPVERVAPPPENLEVVASVEQRPQVPKAIRQRLSTARSEAQRATESAKDELMQRLTAPKQGAAASMEELKTNIDAKEAGRVSDVNRVTGAVAALPTDAPGFARDGGAEHSGPLAGDAAEGIKQKLALAPKKQSGPVRGKVTGMKSGTRVTGQLDPGEVYRVIDASITKILACYERRLQVTPGLAGRITFRWTVMPNGSVTNVQQHVSTVPDPKVASCIKGVLGKLRFPKPEGGSVEISYPFIFRSN